MENQLYNLTVIFNLQLKKRTIRSVLYVLPTIRLAIYLEMNVLF